MSRAAVPGVIPSAPTQPPGTIEVSSILKTNKARAIRFSTLDALCRELECQPGDLLVWTPDEPGGDGT